ncbi:MAG: cytochrome c biogenesis protein ResB [Candidatus Riflebacteria bacterium]|nr:cytochrome c biogenesis protein ResB [Candidatus Riflebacteria bacterium]
MRTLHRIFVSLRTAVVLLTLIALISVIGTFIPQKLDPADYLRIYPKFGELILSLGLDDLYQSGLFTGLLFFLALCALFCTKTRFSITRKRLFHRFEKVETAEIRTFPLAEELGEVSNIDIRLAGWQKKETPKNDWIYFLAHGRKSLIGGFLIHVGLLVVLAGGLIGRYTSFETEITGREGEIKPFPPIDSIKAAAKADSLRRKGRILQLKNKNDPMLPQISSEITALEKIYQTGIENPFFKIRFDKLSVDEYQIASGEQRPLIKQWNSALTFIKDEKNVASAVVWVNSPCSYSGISFFQAGWKKVYSEVKFKATMRNGSGSTTQLGPWDFVASVGVPLKPSWSPYTLVLLDFFPDFRIINQEFTSISEDLNNPAGRIVAYDSKENMVGRAWAFSSDMNELGEHISNLPYNFSFVKATTAFESSLQVSFDPSVPIVWLGTLIMGIGLFLAFYVTYVENWVVLKPDGRIIAAITGNLPQKMLKPYLDELLGILQEEEVVPEIDTEGPENDSSVDSEETK